MFGKIQHTVTQSIALYGLLVILILYNAFFITYAFKKHAAFQTAGLDLGNYEQVLWNTVHGRPMALTTMQNITSNWQIHFEPILMLIVPVYAFFPAPHTLIVLQTVTISLGAIPIFLLAKQKLSSPMAGLTFAVVYLLFPALQGALLFDFHAFALAATFISWALWFLFNRHYWPVLVLTLLAMACKENVALLVLMMGGYIALVQRQWRWGVTIGGIGAAWFGLVNLVFIPSVSPVGENIHLARYSQWGDSMSSVIMGVALNPLEVLRFMFSGDRLLYWVRLTMPVAFIALLNPLVLFMALPELVINTLSTYPPNYQLDQLHYSVAIVPFVVVAGINGVARLVEFAAPKFKHVSASFLQTILLALILFATLAYQVQFGHTPIGRYFDWPKVTEHHHQAETMLAQIPSEAAVAAQNNLVTRLSQREWIFILPKLSQADQQAEYIVVDMQSPLFPYDH
ncbi:MAG: DUF2079 domain-containing protein, partial [Anaerolineae bacterium]|nr:DUF2079 domain-containing protein [Anaerolineae bacterium]